MNTRARETLEHWITRVEQRENTGSEEHALIAEARAMDMDTPPRDAGIMIQALKEAFVELTGHRNFYTAGGRIENAPNTILENLDRAY